MLIVGWVDVVLYSNLEATKMIISALDIKKRVAASSYGRDVANISPDLQHCDVGDETFVRLIPMNHITKLIHQCLVMQLNYALYVGAGETVIMFSVLVRFPGMVLERIFLALETAVGQ